MEIAKKPLILIVDDTPKNVQVLSSILHEKGYNICVSTSGIQALELISTESPDLILLDIQMPVMDGFEISKVLKANPKTKDIPIIFLTAVIEPEKILKGFELGAVDYITKPFNIPELAARVATHVEIKKSREQLIELNATKDKFFSIISHDLRNPFSAILSSSELLLKYIDNNEPQKIQKFATNIHSSVSLVNKLLANLIDWASIQTGKLIPKIEKHNLKIIADELWLLNNEIAQSKNITLQNNVISDIYINCDIDMTKTVLRNLLSNAIKFTNNNGNISIGYVEYESEVEVHISDNGVGIEPGNIPYLFLIEKNISTPGTNNERGTGLGLLLCKELIEKQGGKIWVESEVGQGSTFKFTLSAFCD
jgi:signal transduction histidine kinase